MPDILPTIDNEPAQGIQALLDTVYLWNQDVANDLIDKINELIKELDDIVTQGEIKPYSELLAPVRQYIPMFYGNGIYVAAEEVETLPAEPDLSKWILIATKDGNLVAGDGIDIENSVISVEQSVLQGAAAGATAVQPGDLAQVATTGNYNDLNNKPSLGTAAAADVSDFATVAQGAKADTAVQPGDLATVATTGAYSDLSGTPTIPTTLAELTGDVAISSPTEGQLLKYDFAAHKWKNATQTISISFSELTGSPEDNAALKSALDEKADASSLATVATSGSYNDLTNKPTIPAAQVNSDWNADSGVAKILNKPTLGTAAAANASDFATAAQGTKADTALQTRDIIDNLNSTSTTAALSANQGRELESQIVALEGRGRYLAPWNCATGLASTNPPSSPYTYKAGDYFIVGTVGETNYRPSGSQYVIGTASSTVETEEVAINDTYTYDGTSWSLLKTSKVDALPSQVGMAGKFLSTNGTDASWQDVVTYATFPQTWDVRSTTKDFCDDIAADTTAIKGKVYLGDVYFSDMPSNIGNAECVVEIMDGTTAASKVITLTLTSGNVAPYKWVYTYWNNGTNVSGWKTWATSEQGTKADTAVQPSDLAAVATSGSYSDLSGTPSLATVATTGDYDDLLNKPTIPAAQVNSDWDANSGVAQILNKPTLGTMAAESANDYTPTSGLAAVATSGNYSDLNGTPSLAAVATSGSYDDLSNKPTIPAAQVNSDWDANSGVAQILNKPTLGTAAAAATTDFATAAQGSLADTAVQPADLATVATSGSYTDLSNTPTLGTMAAESASDYTPTASLATVALSGAYSDLSGTPSLATVATSGSYNDLIDKPVLGTMASETAADYYTKTAADAAFATAAQGAKADTAVQPADLATVATTGSYEDLTNKPVIPGPSVPQYTTMPAASASNLGEIAQYSGATMPHVEESATISQTVGSGLTDLAVDLDTFVAEEQPSGNEVVSFVARIETDDISPTSYSGGGYEFVIDPATFIAWTRSRLSSTTYNSIVRFDLGANPNPSNAWRLEGYDSNHTSVCDLSIRPTDPSSGITVSQYGSGSVDFNITVTHAWSGWLKNGATVDLADYGIIYTGTPTNGDTLTVDYTAPAMSVTNGYFYKSSAEYSDPTATISQTGGSGLTDLAVDVDTFIEKEQPTGDETVNFVCVDDGVPIWTKNNEVVNLEDYGVVYSGIPTRLDRLTVAYTAPAVTGYYWNQIDVQPSSGGGSTPTLTWYTVSSAGTTITIADTSSANLVKVYKNGLLLQPTDDYTISGTTLTTVAALVVGDKITTEVF